MSDLASAKQLNLSTRLTVSHADLRYLYSYDSFEQPDTDFERALAELYDGYGLSVDRNSIVTTQGTYGAYRLLRHCFDVSKIIKTSYGSSIHETAFRELGFEIEIVPADTQSCFPDLDGLEVLLKHQRNTFVYVNATDGRLPSGEYMTRLALVVASAQCYLVIDADAQFLSFGSVVPMKRYLAAKNILDTTIVLCSVSKEWGLPGLRFGYALASPRLADRIKHYKSKTLELEQLFARHIAAKVARSGSIYDNCRQLQLRYDAVASLLETNGIHYIRPDCGVNVFIRSKNARRLVQRVALRGVHITNGSKYGPELRRYVRVTLSEHKIKLEQAMKIIIEEEKHNE